MGARAGAGRHAASAGSHSAGFTIASPDCRASLRDTESMDGIDSLPNQIPTSGSNGNEPPSAGVQLEACVEYLWNATSDRLPQSVAGPFRANPIAASPWQTNA